MLAILLKLIHAIPGWACATRLHEAVMPDAGPGYEEGWCEIPDYFRFKRPGLFVAVSFHPEVASNHIRDIL